MSSKHNYSACHICGLKFSNDEIESHQLTCSEKSQKNLNSNKVDGKDKNNFVDAIDNVVTDSADDSDEFFSYSEEDDENNNSEEIFASASKTPEAKINCGFRNNPHNFRNIPETFYQQSDNPHNFKNNPSLSDEQSDKSNPSKQPKGNFSPSIEQTSNPSSSKQQSDSAENIIKNSDPFQQQSANTSVSKQEKDNIGLFQQESRNPDPSNEEKKNSGPSEQKIKNPSKHEKDNPGPSQQQSVNPGPSNQEKEISRPLEQKTKNPSKHEKDNPRPPQQQCGNPGPSNQERETSRPSEQKRKNPSKHEKDNPGPSQQQSENSGPSNQERDNFVTFQQQKKQNNPSRAKQRKSSLITETFRYDRKKPKNLFPPTKKFRYYPVTCEYCRKRFQPFELKEHQMKQHLSAIDKIKPGRRIQSAALKKGHEPSTPGSKNVGRMPRSMQICYICGQMYGSQSLKIHEPKCLQKWRIQNEQLPPELRAPEPVKPEPEAESSLPGGSEKNGYDIPDYDPKAEANYRSFLKNLIPCKYCSRTFKPDRVQKHMSCCFERPRHKSKSPISKSKSPERRAKSK